MEHTKNNSSSEPEDTGFNLPQHLKEDTQNAASYQQLADQGFSHVLHDLFIKRSLGYTEFNIPLKLCDRKYPSQETEITELNLHFSLDRRTGKCSFEYFTADRITPDRRPIHQTLTPEFSAIEAISLMAGRAVYRNHLQGGNSAPGWVQLDFNAKDEKGNYYYKCFPEQSFNLDKELEKLPLNEALFSFGSRYETTSKMLKHGEVVEIDFERPQGNLITGEQVCFVQQIKDECGDTIYGHLVRSKPTKDHPEGLATVEDKSGHIHQVSLDVLQRPPERFYLIANPMQQQINIFNEDWKPVSYKGLQEKYPAQEPKAIADTLNSPDNLKSKISDHERLRVVWPDSEGQQNTQESLMVHIDRGQYGYTIAERQDSVLWQKVQGHICYCEADRDEIIFLESMGNFNLESVKNPNAPGTCFDKQTTETFIQTFLENGISVVYRGETLRSIADMDRIDEILSGSLAIGTTNEPETVGHKRTAGMRG